MHDNSNSVPNSHFEFRFWAKRSWKCQFFRLRGHRSCNFNSVSKKRPTFVTPLILLQLLTEISWQKHTVQHVEPNLSSRRCALFFSLEGWGHCTEHKQKWVLQECFDQHWKPSFSESSLLFWARAGFQLHLLYKKHFEKKHQQVFTLPKLSSLECSKVGTNDFQQAMSFLGTTQKFAIYKSRVDKLIVSWEKVCPPLASMTSGLCFSLKLCFQQRCFCASTKSSGTVAMLNWMRCKFWNKQLSLGSTGHWWWNQGEAYTNREQHNQDDYVIVVFLQALAFYETSKTHLL